MNSALQCMSNSIDLTKYFLFGLHKDEINYNNPLGTKGRLAAAYAKLMRELWVSSDSRVAPWDLKKAIGTVAYQFQGFAQQDSFELFNYVADTLHEDLNRVIEKPITEFADSNGRPDEEVSADHWKAFTDRNKSVIVDLMYGQLKSRLICTVCNNISNTFDPYLALSVPIPKNKMGKLNIVYFPVSLNDGKKVMRFKMNFEYNDTVNDLIEKLKEKFNSQYEMLVYSFRRRYQLDEERLDGDVLLSKLDDEKIAAYEYQYNGELKKNLCVVPVTITYECRTMFSSSSSEEVCEQMVFVISLKKTVSDLRRMIFKYLFPIFELPEQYQEKYESMNDTEKAIKLIYDNVYLKTDYGPKKFMIYQYEKEKSQYSSFRKYGPVDDSDQPLDEYFDSINTTTNYSMRVHLPSKKVNLEPLISNDKFKNDTHAISVFD